MQKDKLTSKKLTRTIKFLVVVNMKIVVTIPDDVKEQYSLYSLFHRELFRESDLSIGINWNLKLLVDHSKVFESHVGTKDKNGNPILFDNGYKFINSIYPSHHST